MVPENFIGLCNQWKLALIDSSFSFFIRQKSSKSKKSSQRYREVHRQKELLHEQARGYHEHSNEVNLQ